MALEAARQAVASGSSPPACWEGYRLCPASKMSEPNYQFRDYPCAIAERAWQCLAGHHRWMTLDRFVAILSKTTKDEALSRDLVKAAVSSQVFCGPSGRRLLLFLPKPLHYSNRSEAWRVTAKDYADAAKRFAAIDFLDWYLQSVWVLTRVVEDWCSNKGYEIGPQDLEAPRAATPKELRGKTGPKDKYDWKAIKDTVFLFMNTHGDFQPDRGWYQAELERRVLEELDNQPDLSGLRRRLKGWLGEWRSAQNRIRT